MENLKLQFDHDSLYLCLLFLVLLWLGYLMLNGCFEKYHEKKRRRTKKYAFYKSNVSKLCKFSLWKIDYGYLTAPSIKDHKYARRLRKSMLIVGRT